MCGRYVLPYSWQDILDDLDGHIGRLKIPVVADVVADMPPRYNIAPTQPILVLHAERGEMKATMMRWGFIPVWIKDPREFPLIINARSETILEKPAFRGGLRHHRCVIPAAGYYEWHKGADGKKQPYYVSSANDQLMWFGGVYANWMGPSGEEIDTAAIITVAASQEIAHLHPRAPAILDPSQIADWLDVDNVPERKAHQMLQPPRPGSIVYHPVSLRVNAVKNDASGLIEPFAIEPIVEDQQPGQLDLF